MKILPEEGVLLPNGSELTGWEPNLFCTFVVNEVEDRDIERMVHSILEKYYGLEQTCKIQISTMELA